MTTRRYRPSGRPSLAYLACLEGREPAEALSTAERECLVAVLARRGWSAAEIAEHTGMTTYTTGRICDRIRLRQLERRRAG